MNGTVSSHLAPLIGPAKIEIGGCVLESAHWAGGYQEMNFSGRPVGEWEILDATDVEIKLWRAGDEEPAIVGRGFVDAVSIYDGRLRGHLWFNEVSHGAIRG